MRDRRPDRLVNVPNADPTAEVDREIGFHLERLTASFMTQGMDERSARAAARERFGDLERARKVLGAGALAREQGRRRTEFAGELTHDVRYALRTLWRQRVFAAAAILTLALGIGANTSMFAVAHALLLRPLPYADADRLVLLWQNNTMSGDVRYPFSPANYRDLVEGSRTLASTATYGTVGNSTVTIDGEPEQVKATAVSVDFYHVVGVSPAIGQVPGEADGVVGTPRKAVISDGYWRRRFAADPSVIGKQVDLFMNTVTIVGVMPPGFTVPGADAVDVVLAQQYETSFWAVRPRHSLRVIARLSDEATVGQASTEANAIFARLEATHPSSNRGMKVTLLGLRDALVGNVRTTLLVLLGAVALVLLIACANITNLLLARAAERSREFSIRAALGAGRGRIVRQLLTESALLAALGSGAGLLLAAVLLRVLRVAGTATLPMLDRVSLSGNVLLFALALTALTALLVGMLPALQGAAARLAALRENTRALSFGRGHHSTRRGLAIVQVALSLALLCGAGLLLRSYQATMAVDPGFATDRVLTFSTMKMGNDTVRTQHFDELERRLASLPGVRAVGGISQLPLTGAGGRAQAQVYGVETRPGDRHPEVRWRTVTPGYFDVMDLRVQRGRVYNDADRANREIQLVINQETAKRLFGSRDPVGGRLRLGPDTASPYYPVIGVVENARNESMTKDFEPEVYTLHTAVAPGMMTTALSTSVPPLTLTNQVRAQVRELDPSIFVADVRTTGQLISSTLSQPRFMLLVLGAFAMLSVLVAVIGTYGVLAVSVAQRKREIGIRMALGAQRANILRLIVGEGVFLAGTGVAIGLGVALAGSRALQGMLFQVTPADPLTFGTTAMVIALTTIAASAVPAMAAARLQPESVMRGE